MYIKDIDGTQSKTLSTAVNGTLSELKMQEVNKEE